jgi:hypothetical protein
MNKKIDVPNQEWFTLAECCKLKNLNIKTAYNRKVLKPNFGRPEGHIGGVQMWRRATLIKWLGLTDDDIFAEESLV